MQIVSSYIRNLAIEAFRKEFKVARRLAMVARIKKQDANLPKFEDEGSTPQRNKRFIGLKAIPTDHIMGTVGRDGDFDLNFRPLKKHLRERWVNAFVLVKTQPWSPIRAYKKGSRFFIEDGHHRVSVAHHLGMDFIDAEVWEYPEKEDKTQSSNPLPPALRFSTVQMSSNRC